MAVGTPGLLQQRSLARETPISGPTFRVHQQRQPLDGCPVSPLLARPDACPFPVAMLFPHRLFLSPHRPVCFSVTFSRLQSSPSLQIPVLVLQASAPPSASAESLPATLPRRPCVLTPVSRLAAHTGGDRRKEGEERVTPVECGGALFPPLISQWPCVWRWGFSRLRNLKLREGLFHQ